MIEKKGLVYRATMVFGFALIGYETAWQIGYYKYIRKDRNEELQEERENQFKRAKCKKLSKEEQDEEENEALKKEGEAAKARTTWLSSREDFKQKRLEKILAQREKAGFNPTAPTTEELAAKPSLKDIRMRPLVQKAETEAGKGDDKAEDAYM